MECEEDKITWIRRHGRAFCRESISNLPIRFLIESGVWIEVSSQLINK